MAEILKEWLSERLKQPFKWEAENFGELMKDGHIIARLLFNYKAISEDDHLLVLPATTQDEISNNWRHLTTWLQRIDIVLSESEVDDILQGRSSALLRLYYQLFLNLDRKDRTDFIKKERKLVSNLVTKMGNRFNIQKVDEAEIPVIDYLAKPLIDQKYFIEWQKNKAEQMKLTYDYIRSKYLKTCEKIEESKIPVKREIPKKPFKFTKEKHEMDKFERQHPCAYNNYSYAELMELDTKINNEETWSVLDKQWAKDYLNNLKSKFTNRSETKEFQKRMAATMSSTIWEQTINEEEDKLDLEMAENVMKLSHFEKQMCTQLMETKQQARSLIQNQIDAQREFSKQREHQFGQYLDDLRNTVHMEFVEVDLEKQRQDELHKKLFAEKVKRKREHYYEICYDTMLSIVDYAVKFAHMTLLTGVDVPPHFIHEWKALYFKQQPIFDILEHVEDILNENEAEDKTEVELIVHLELDRQNCLNENDFKEYYCATGPWTLEYLIPNYQVESAKNPNEHLGLRVLGNIVHKLLEIKYPLPPVKQPAALPTYKSKAILRCLPDRSITVSMQILLDKKRIHVVRVEAAIYYCLNSFKTELIGCMDLNLSFDKYLEISADSDKELMKLLKDEDESSFNETSQTGVVALNAKQTQTPKTIPEEDIVFSPSAELGKTAYESLCNGQAPTDHVISAIVVEYLKSLKDIRGFVLINYPNSYQQAQILEETFLGLSPPDADYLDNADDIYLEKYKAKTKTNVEDVYEDVRKSKLVPDPRTTMAPTTFISYFTSYILLKETVNVQSEHHSILDLKEFESEDNYSEVIDTYYTDQYINYSICYEEIDKDVLAQICRFIIGDFEMPFKDSDSLFGLGILTSLEFPTSEDKRLKSKVIKQEASSSKTKINKLKRSSKGSKIVMSAAKISSPTENNITESLQSIIEVNSEMESIVAEEIVDNATPGEDNWIYADLPLHESFAVLLASVWEESEQAYIQDLENLFFATRLQMNNIVPYTRFAKDKVEQIITRPNVKPELVSKFLNQYNNFEGDWRFSNVTKIEWHCRIQELQRALYEVCDKRKKDALAERYRLILDNWTLEEVTAMANTFISCMQSEINRATLTFQLLQDFCYTAMKRPLSTDRIVPHELTKLMRESDESPRSKRSANDKMFSKVKETLKDMHIKNITVDHSNNPYNQVLENNVKSAIKSIIDLNAQYNSIISKEYIEFSNAKPNKKLDNNTGSAELNEELLKQNMLKCLDEWKVAIDGEMQRVDLRLKMISNKALVDLELFNEYTSRMFLEIEDEVNEHYLREIQSVNQLCEYLQLAVENGERIQESLILDLDQFIIDPNIKQFPSPPPSPPQEVKEREVEGEFRVAQLARLRDQLKLVASTGIIMEQSLIYVLQDFLLHGKESCASSLSPRTWTQLEPEQIPELVFRVFGETAYVDWRDLLIYSLNISFPSVTILLKMRKNMRCVDTQGSELISRKDFLNMSFWFEDDLSSDDPQIALRIHLMKQFMFELFETMPDVMNYSAFLLALCKNTDPIMGFAAAVSIVEGQIVCWDLEECEPVINKLIELKDYKQACRACAVECSDKFASTLLDNVVQQCEGTVITEIVITPSMLEQPDKKKGKQKPAKGKGKHEKVTPRNSKQKSPEKKVAAKTSETNEVTPSQNDLAKVVDIETIEATTDGDTAKPLEDEPEPFPPPGITYAVSLEVIWNILQVSMPWHFKCVPIEKETSYAENIANVLENLGCDTENGDVYLAKFLNDPVVCEILHKVKRFQALNFLQIAANMAK